MMPSAIQRNRSLPKAGAVLCAALLVSYASAWAGLPADGSSDNFPNDPQARELVRKVVTNELKQEEVDKSHYLFTYKKITPKETSVKQVVQTDQGSISRTLSVNGKALTQDQQQAEEQKLQKLLSDPDEQKKHLKREQEDQNRAQIMVRALPNAFFYQIIGREGDIAKLRFRPDPGYKPQSHEESVYTGMAGELWLNVGQDRLQRIDAHLLHDVDFGWGILGRLFKGGTLMVQQEHVDGNHWDATVVKLDLTGRIMLFKALVEKEQEYESDFHRLPDHVSLSQGAEILKKGTPEVAQK